MNKPSNIVIDVHNAGITVGAIELNGITLQLYEGEILALLSPKKNQTTIILEMLQGLFKHSIGSIDVLGGNPNDNMNVMRSQTGCVLPSWRDHKDWIVQDLINHFVSHYQAFSLKKQISRGFTMELIELTGIQSFVKKRIRNLSANQRRQLDIAIGLAGDPKILFIDEPTQGLDLASREKIHGILHELVDKNNMAIVFTTTDFEEAEKLADKLVIVAEDQIVAQGSIDKLKKDFSTNAEILWTIKGQRHIHSTKDATSYVWQLLNSYKGEIVDLEVRRDSLESTYLNLVRKAAQNTQNIN